MNVRHPGIHKLCQTVHVLTIFLFPGDYTMARKEFAKLLQGFIESSCIGEFAARLELISMLYKIAKDDEHGKFTVQS